jgi:hypothetical protein
MGPIARVGLGTINLQTQNTKQILYPNFLVKQLRPNRIAISLWAIA